MQSYFLYEPKSPTTVIEEEIRSTILYVFDTIKHIYSKSLIQGQIRVRFKELLLIT